MNDMHEACQNVAEFFPLSAQEVEDILCIRAASGGSIRSATEEACAYAKALRAEQDRAEALEKVALEMLAFCRDFKHLLDDDADMIEGDFAFQLRALGVEVPQ